MSQIDLYFRFPDTGFEFRVPVIPSEINITDGSDWHRVNVLGLGEVALPAFRKAQEISFSSFFPYQYDPGYCQYPNFMHPNDASNLFNVAMGTDQSKGGKRPQIVRFIMVEEYEDGAYATWVDDDFAIENFAKKHQAQELTDQHYTITLRSARVPSLRATGSLADNIGSQKPHPNVNRTGEDDPTKTVTTGKSKKTISRPRQSPINLQLKEGVDIGDTSSKLSGINYSKLVEEVSPLGGSKYSYTAPDGMKWGVDSSGDVIMAKDGDPNALGNYLTSGTNYTVQQILRDEETNNGGVVILSGGGPQ